MTFNETVDKLNKSEDLGRVELSLLGLHLLERLEVKGSLTADDINVQFLRYLATLDAFDRFITMEKQQKPKRKNHDRA